MTLKYLTAAAILALSLSFTALAQAPGQSVAQTAGQDLKQAGSDTKNAAKKTGSAVKQTTKTTGKTIKHETNKTAQKVADKTSTHE